MGSLKIDDHNDLALSLRRYMFELIATSSCQRLIPTLLLLYATIPTWNPLGRVFLLSERFK